MNLQFTSPELPSIDEDLKSTWWLDQQTVYLNHGSFGPMPRHVYEAQRDLMERCQRQPMNFFLRELRPAWLASRQTLADFVGTSPANLIFCENATFGMNHLASFFPLAQGDEVLFCDHEYGVVKRIWERRCREEGARCREISLSFPIEAEGQIVQAFSQAITEKTKLLIISHITSPTAITFPVEKLTAMAKDRQIAVCIDGPHAPLQIPVDVDELHCDFYIASCHKWLCAPFGSGFLYVAPQWQELAARPLALSWGRLPPEPIEHWSDAYQWQGTRDYSTYLSIAHAITYFQSMGVTAVRKRNHQLAKFARQALEDCLGTKALVPDHADWYSMMASVWLPDGDHSTLQKRLWHQHRIEVPITFFANRYLIRVSCHLYNSTHDIQHLCRVLHEELAS